MYTLTKKSKMDFKSMCDTLYMKRINSKKKNMSRVKYG